jgi:aminopeptidase-like protein
MIASVSRTLTPAPSAYPNLDALFDELFPIMRSITGPGLLESINAFARYMPLEIETVPSYTEVFDWQVPPEWHFRKAMLVAPDGTVIADAANCNLHVLNYSEPIDRKVSLEELDQHLHSLPELPDAIPYATSYYKRNWGFCIPHKVRLGLQPGYYHARIDSSFVAGGVPFAQCTLAGETEAEILLSSYLCHPSLANNELSGPLVLLGLYYRIAAWPRRRYTYRFLLNPETIGSLCFLSRYAARLKRNLAAGIVLTCLGGPAESLSYKISRSGRSVLDRWATRLWENGKILLRKFDPAEGSDERQYCSAGFNLPVGQFSRTVYGQYKGYHNSLDTKSFMTIAAVEKSIDEIEQIVRTLEICGAFRNLAPYGEPQLGRRGLYPNLNAASTRKNSDDRLVDDRTFLNRMLTVLSYSDGEHSMLEIADRMGCGVEVCRPVVERLEEAGLLQLISPGTVAV